MTDTRFTIEPHLRRPARYDTRNPDGMVRDGYFLSDAVTGMRRWFELRREAVTYRDRILRREAAAQADDRLVAWQANFDKQRRPGGFLVEVRGVIDGDHHTEMLALIGAEDEQQARARVAAWLEHVGLTGLPEQS